MDGISLVMVLLTTALMPLSVLGSWRYITRQERGFYALMLTLLTGLVRTLRGEERQAGNALGSVSVSVSERG